MTPGSDGVYLDNHATTPLDPAVLEAMMPWLTVHFGNPGSVGHAFGDRARKAVSDARELVAACLNVQPTEIVFTSGATESNNLALRGIAERYGASGAHFISATTEHKAVLDPLEKIAASAGLVTLLPPSQSPNQNAGYIDPQQVAAAIQAETRLASVMYVNNEIGIIQPIREIAAVCHEDGVLLHCDATQAVGKLPIDLQELDADLVSFSGHKVYGPRGVGALVVRRRRPRIKLSSQMDGGGQEQGRRSGTLNVPGIVGLAKAVELATSSLVEESKRIVVLRDDLYSQISKSVSNVTLNGPEISLRVPGNLNLRFDGVDGEALMMNMGDVAVSSGSACTSANPEPSHVLRAIGLSEDETRSSLRFGIGRFNTQADIDLAASTVAGAVARLRDLA